MSTRPNRGLLSARGWVTLPAMAPTADPTAPPPRVDTPRARWDATVAELVRLRREETAQEEAAEDALADELHRAFRARRPGPRPTSPRPTLIGAGW